MLSIVPMLVAYVIVFLYTFERIPGLFDPRCLGRDVLICLPALVVSAFIYWQISFIFGPEGGMNVGLHAPTLVPRRSEARWRAWFRLYVWPETILLYFVLLLTHPLTCACICTSFEFTDLIRSGVLSNALLLQFYVVYLFFMRYVFERFKLIKAEQQRTVFQHLLLRQQVDPHFLFNCLTSSATLTEDDPARARTFLGELASVYRYILGMSERRSVTLDEEMSFVRAIN